MLFQVVLEIWLGWKTDLSYHLKVLKIHFWIISRYCLVGILFGSLALFVFIELIMSSMSSGRVGERKIVLLFSQPRKVSVCFWLGNIFIYFYSNTCKNVIEIVGKFFFSSFFFFCIQNIICSKNNITFVFPSNEDIWLWYDLNCYS